MTGEGRVRGRWTWGDWVLLALPLAVLPVVAGNVGAMPAQERSTGWTLFLGSAAAAAGIAGAFVYRFLTKGGSPDPAAQRQNRTRNTGLAVTFGIAALFFVRRAADAPRLVAMGLAFGSLTVTMLGYAFHVLRTRDDGPAGGG